MKITGIPAEPQRVNNRASFALLGAVLLMVVSLSEFARLSASEEALGIVGQYETNPLSPPLRSPQQRPQGHPAKSKFLAAAANLPYMRQPQGHHPGHPLAAGLLHMQPAVFKDRYRLVVVASGRSSSARAFAAAFLTS